ncbi:MAG TPA: hypothetical protein VIX11_05280 [Candidatus Acidoferrum sp.]
MRPDYQPEMESCPTNIRFVLFYDTVVLDWRRRYLHLMMRREKRIAKVAMARKLAVRLYWMWRNSWQYSQLVEFGSNAGKLVTGHGVK